MITSLTQAKNTDATVHRILSLGGTQADCVVALVNEKEALAKRIMELDAIAPKKIKLDDGRVMIWHCPDDLVPLQPNNSGLPRRVSDVGSDRGFSS